MADGLRAVEPGELTFPILQKTVDEVVTVSEEAIRDTLCLILERTKMLVEPSGAVALAALVSGVVSLPGRCVGVVLSGGNLSLETLARLLPAADPA
jgi:threonine dehydratase